MTGALSSKCPKGDWDHKASRALNGALECTFCGAPMADAHRPSNPLGIRLREEAEGANSNSDEANTLMCEAAAEIERLETFVKACVSQGGKQVAEIERLRAALHNAAVNLGLSGLTETARQRAWDALEGWRPAKSLTCEYCLGDPECPYCHGVQPDETTPAPEVGFFYSTAYCQKHLNWPWSMKVTVSTINTALARCPICEPPPIPSAETSGGT